MTVVYITEFAYKDRSTTNYDWAKEQIGDDPVDGLIVHTAGFDEDAKVFRIMDVWESQEDMDRWMQTVMPILDPAVAQFGEPTVRVLNVHNLVTDG